MNAQGRRSSRLKNGAFTPESSPVRGSRAKKGSVEKAWSLYDEIRSQVDTNHGEELPCMTNPKVLKPLFRKQTSKWQAIGTTYLRNVASMTSEVSAKILEEVCAELGVRSQTENELGNIIFSFKNAREKDMIGELQAYYQENSTFPLQTNNKIFTQKVREAQNLRFQGALERYRKNNPPEKFLITIAANGEKQSLESVRPKFSHWAIVDTNNLTELFEQMNPRGVQNTEDEIHDVLKAYYEVSPLPFRSFLCS
jgi:hypothetical protein